MFRYISDCVLLLLQNLTKWSNTSRHRRRRVKNKGPFSKNGLISNTINSVNGTFNHIRRLMTRQNSIYPSPDPKSLESEERDGQSYSFFEIVILSLIAVSWIAALIIGIAGMVVNVIKIECSQTLLSVWIPPSALLCCTNSNIERMAELFAVPYIVVRLQIDFPRFASIWLEK